MSEQKNTITLEIEGAKITPEKFTKSIKAFFDFINEVSSDIGGKKKPIEWFVKVESGSIRIQAVPDPVSAPERIIFSTMQTIKDGIDILSLQATKPPHFSDTALSRLDDLATLVNGQNTDLDYVKIYVNNDRKDISRRIGANIDQIMGYASKSYGSIEGTLDTVSKRKRFHTVISDPLTNKPVRCYFGNLDMPQADVLAMFGKRVSVYGLIKYRKDGFPISINVEDVRLFKSEKDLPSARDVLGILRD